MNSRNKFLFEEDEALEYSEMRARRPTNINRTRTMVKTALNSRQGDDHRCSNGSGPGSDMSGLIVRRA